MRRLTLAAAFVLLATPASAGPPRWLVNATCGGAATLAFGEIVLTESCVQRGTCRETNPVMPKGQDKSSSVTRASIKGAGAAATIRLAYAVKNPWARFAVCASYGTLNTYLLKRGWDRLP